MNYLFLLCFLFAPLYTSGDIPEQRYYGNFCGPKYGYPEKDKPAIDAVDQVCKDHDFCYAEMGILFPVCDFAAAGKFALAAIQPGISADGRAFALAAASALVLNPFTFFQTFMVLDDFYSGSRFFDWYTKNLCNREVLCAHREVGGWREGGFVGPKQKKHLCMDNEHKDKRVEVKGSSFKTIQGDAEEEFTRLCNTVWKDELAMPAKCDHFYSTDPNESKDSITEGITGYIYSTEIQGSVPWFRWYNANPPPGDHFYTTDPSGELAPSLGYVKEGKVGYLPRQGEAGAVPLYRWLLVGGDHFYTTDQSGELASLQPGAIKEGLAGYIFPTQKPGTVALYRKLRC